MSLYAVSSVLLVRMKCPEMCYTVIFISCGAKKITIKKPQNISMLPTTNYSSGMGTERSPAGRLTKAKQTPHNNMRMYGDMETAGLSGCVAETVWFKISPPCSGPTIISLSGKSGWHAVDAWCWMACCINTLRVQYSFDLRLQPWSFHRLLSIDGVLSCPAEFPFDWLHQRCRTVWWVHCVVASQFGLKHSWHMAYGSAFSHTITLRLNVTSVSKYLGCIRCADWITNITLFALNRGKDKGRNFKEVAR